MFENYTRKKRRLEASKPNHGRFISIGLGADKFDIPAALQGTQSRPGFPAEGLSHFGCIAHDSDFVLLMVGAEDGDGDGVAVLDGDAWPSEKRTAEPKRRVQPRADFHTSGLSL